VVRLPFRPRDTAISRHNMAQITSDERELPFRCWLGHRGR
jgi:hypothetical protein